MKKCLAFFCFLIFFLFLFKPVYGFEFVKSPDNPLPLSYDFGYDRQQQVHIYKEGELFKGILTASKPGQSNHSLLSITSTDGINWYVSKEILTIDNYDINNGRLFIDDSGQKTLFFSRKDGPDFYKIYKSECNADLECNPEISVVLDPNRNDLSEKNGYFAPYVIKDNGIYWIFYGVWGNDGFKIRLAHSTDLSNWEKCSGDLIKNGSDGPFPIIIDDNVYLFFHQSNASGIKLAKSTLPLDCSADWEDMGYAATPSQSYDLRHTIFPSVIDNGDKLLLYYSGLSTGNAWSTNLAIVTQSIPQTPTPTLTPTPTEKYPLVIVPGFFASYNRSALLHNETTVAQHDWYTPDFVKEYNALIHTLEENKYKINADFFVFNYDWRKKIRDIEVDFDLYINNILSLTGKNKVNIVGHSLGGVISRFFQEREPDKVFKNITLASPHLGVPQVYKPVGGGEIEKENSLLWLAEKSLLLINKKGFESDKNTINRVFPILSDLLPVYPYLKKGNNYLDIDSLIIKNNYLIATPSLSDNTTVFASDYQDTLFGYTLGKRTTLDKMLDLYPDGRPMVKLFDKGDVVVPFISAGIGQTPIIVNKGHGEIIYDKSIISQILSILKMNFDDNLIFQGEGTTLSPSLIFFLKSPAEMKVIFGQNEYREKDGMIYIENAKKGVYKLEITGKENGLYQVVIGELGIRKDSWGKISGIINSSDPKKQIDTYSFSFDPDLPKENFIKNNDSLSLFWKIMDLLRQKYKNQFDKTFPKYLKNKKQYLTRDNYLKLISFLIDHAEYDLLEILKQIYGNLPFKNKCNIKKCVKSLAAYDKKISLLLSHPVNKLSYYAYNQVLLCKASIENNNPYDAAFIIDILQTLDRKL